jgi:hypothetical protein
MATVHTQKIAKMLKDTHFTDKQTETLVEVFWSLTEIMVTKEEFYAALEKMATKEELTRVDTDLRLLRKDVENLFYKIMISMTGITTGIVGIGLTIFGYIIHH